MTAGSTRQCGPAAVLATAFVAVLGVLWLSGEAWQGREHAIIKQPKHGAKVPKDNRALSSAKSSCPAAPPLPLEPHSSNETLASGYDVILLAGQSNMSGRGKPIDEALDAVHPRIFQFPSAGPYRDTIIPAKDPLYMFDTANASVKTRGLGPGLPFARWYTTTLPATQRILLVPGAIGASGFYCLRGPCWDPAGGAHFKRVVQQVNKALAAAGNNSRLAVILWMQGEFDHNSVPPAEYAERLDRMIDAFRLQVTGASTVPIIIGQLLPEFVARSENATAIDAVQRSVPNRKPFTAFAHAPLSCGQDDRHYSAAGHRAMGWRLFQALPAALSNTLPE